LGQIIESSLKKGDKFTEEDLLGAAPPSSLVTHVPLDFLWERVIVPLIAEGHDYAPKKTEPKAAEAEGGWSLRPDTDPTAKAEPLPPAAPAPVEEGEMVGEDEIIETEDEVRASEGSIALGVRKAGGAPPAKKFGQG
jgi:hypothetical protein